jgi:hypothetical protein
VQVRQRAWLREVLDSQGLKPAQLAAGAKTSTSTLTRFLNDPTYTGTLSSETVERIKSTFKVPGPDEYANRRRSTLIGLSEAVRFDPKKEDGGLASIVKAIIGGRIDVDAWRLKTMSLEGVGYLPGDIVFVQALPDGQMPKPQDVVCAQVIDYTHGAAETVWRVFDPPFLVGAAHDRTAYKPLLVDGERVKVFGIVLESYRPHNFSATR